MTLIGPQLAAAFQMFKRPLVYKRNTEPDVILEGTVVETPVDAKLAGDVGQALCTVTLLVDDMMLKDRYPPLKYDRVEYDGNSHAITERPRIQYDGDTPLFVRLRCEG
jgi:hypothetical protein